MPLSSEELILASPGPHAQAGFLFSSMAGGKKERMRSLRKQIGPSAAAEIKNSVEIKKRQRELSYAAV
jgi:hypothetical protein